MPTSGPLPRRGPWRCTQSQSVSHHEYADRRDTHPHPIRQRSIQPIPIPSPTRISMCPFSSAFLLYPHAQSRPRPAARTLKPCARAQVPGRRSFLDPVQERDSVRQPRGCARARWPHIPPECGWEPALGFLLPIFGARARELRPVLCGSPCLSRATSKPSRPFLSLRLHSGLGA